MREIFNPKIFMTTVRLGIRPANAYSHQVCRITGWQGWLPWPKRTFTVRKAQEYTAVVSLNGLPATFLNIHPCHIMSMVWHMKELHTMVDAMTAVTELSRPMGDLYEMGLAIHDWIAYDKPISENMLMQMRWYRNEDRDFASPLFRVRPLLWELFGASRIAVSAIETTRELYVQEVDDTPWIPANKKPSALDQ